MIRVGKGQDRLSWPRVESIVGEKHEIVGIESCPHVRLPPSEEGSRSAQAALSGTNDRRVMYSPQRSLATSSGTMTRGPSIDELRVCQYHRAIGEIHTLPALLAFFSLPHTFTSPTTRFVCPPPSRESGTSSSFKTRVYVPCFLKSFSVPFCLRQGVQLREGDLQRRNVPRG